MKPWMRRGLAGLAAVLGAFVYFEEATRLEERALAAQQPGAAAADVAARHVDRDQLMRDVTLFGHDRPIYRAGGVENWTYASDHAAFHAEGVPFVYFGWPIMRTTISRPTPPRRSTRASLARPPI